MQALLRAGAKVKAETVEDQATALHLAAYKGSVETVQVCSYYQYTVRAYYALSVVVGRRARRCVLRSS